MNSILLHSGDGISPSITYDWLTLDDDDGDLENGTPHSPEILAGFAMHNMDDFPEPPEPLDNDECETARVEDGSHPFTTIGGNSSSDPYNDNQCSGTYLGDMFADVWFSYTACGNGSMLVSTCDMIDFDSDIVVYQGNCDNKIQVACNGDSDNCSGYTSETYVSVTEGETYLIRVGGWSSGSWGGSGEEGTGQLVIDGPGEPCSTPPCPGDIDQDGSVGVSDLLTVVAMWGESGGIGDVDGNGTVGVGDVLAIVEVWGECP